MNRVDRQPGELPPARAELADAVRDTITQTNLALQRLATRMRKDGLDVSASALSRYQRGQALPPKSILIALHKIAAERTKLKPAENRKRQTEMLDLLARAEDLGDEEPPVPVRLVTPTLPAAPAEITSAADTLAEMVREQWEHAAADRGLLRPTPVAVRWCWSRQPVTGPIDEAVGDPHGPTLPGRPTVTTAALRTGDLRDLFAVYGGLNSGRVVLLGKPGTGKSTAAVLTLLDALRHRQGLDEKQRAQVPVPVLLTTHGWDPHNQPLGDWLADRLADDYPILRSGDYGRNTAKRLVKTGRIALFLDGLDELTPDLRSVAIAAVNRQPAWLRLIVMTRSEEFANAVNNGHIYSAAALELQPISADDAADYLERCLPQPLPQPWQRLVTHLREHPDGTLASALDNPLNLTLLRDAFPDPDEIEALLIPGRFGSRHEIESYLLGRVVPVAYRPEPGMPRTFPPDKAQLMLGYIAAKLNDQETRDLAWWHMHRWASPIPRILTAGLLGSILGPLVGALVFGPVGQYTVKGMTGTAFGIWYGAAMSVSFGLLTGFVSEFRDRRPHRFAARSVPFNPAVGLLIGMGIGLAVGNQSHYAFGVPAGLLGGIIAGHAATRVRHCAWPPTLMLRSWVDLKVGCLAGLIIGVVYGSTKGLTPGIAAGLVSALVFGLMVGAARPSADEHSTTDPETSWRRDRRRAVSFGLASGLPLGCALGLGNGIAHGPLPGIVAAVGFGTIISVGAMVGVSDAWRATLLFLQLRPNGFSIKGMQILRDAYNRNVLRTVGPLYQFRHALLQDNLAKTYHRTNRGGETRLHLTELASTTAVTTQQTPPTKRP